MPSADTTTTTLATDLQRLGFNHTADQLNDLIAEAGGSVPRFILCQASRGFNPWDRAQSAKRMRLACIGMH